jgi:hypothetical protein
MSSLHSLQRAKNLTAFCYPHLPEVVRQLAWDPAEMKIFYSQQIVQTPQAVTGDTSRASVSEYQSGRFWTSDRRVNFGAPNRRVDTNVERFEDWRFRSHTVL